MDILTIKNSDGSTFKLEYHDSLSSTAELARKYAEAGYPDRYTVFCEKQRSTLITGSKLPAGEHDKGIFLSVLLRPSIFPSQVGLLGPLSAVALVTALEEHTDEKIGIGWVSDVYLEGNRVGGVQIEGKLDSYSSYEYLIVTFAVHTDEKLFPPRVTDMIRQVFGEENLTIGMIIAKTVLARFFEVYSSLKTPGKYMDIYQKKFVLYGKKIKYIGDGKKKNCRIANVDKKSASLLIETRRGEIKEITSPRNIILPRRIKMDNAKRPKAPL